MKLLYGFLFLLSFQLTYCQDKNIDEAKLQLFNYQKSMSRSDLESSIVFMEKNIAKESSNKYNDMNYLLGYAYLLYFQNLEPKEFKSLNNSFSSLYKIFSIKKSVIDTSIPSKTTNLMNTIFKEKFNSIVNDYNGSNFVLCIEKSKDILSNIKKIENDDNVLIIENRSKILQEITTKTIEDIIVQSYSNTKNYNQLIEFLKKKNFNTLDEFNVGMYINALIETKSSESFEIVKKAIQLFPNNDEYLLLDINNDISKKTFDSTSFKIEKILAKKPDLQLYTTLAKIYEIQKNDQKAIETNEKALVSFPSDFNSNLRLAYLYYNKGVEMYNKKSSSSKNKDYLKFISKAKDYLNICRNINSDDENLKELEKVLKLIK